MTIKSYILTLLSCFVITALKAQTKLSENIFSKKLANGLTVLVIEDNSVPLATVSMTFKNGACNEASNYSGLTYMYHNMLYKANATYGPAERVAYITSTLGMVRNLSVNEENAECHFTMPSFGINEGLKYMNAAIRFPVLDEKGLNEAKNISDKELQGKESNPMFMLNKNMWQYLWGDLYKRKMAIGTHESIQAATLSLMDSIQKKYYYPDNALLTIAGNVSHLQMFNQADELFGTWKASGFDPLKKWPVPPFKPVAQTRYFTVEDAGATVPVILLAWQGPGTRTDIASTYAADVFSYILTQNASKLNKALVQSGLALELSFNYLTLSRGGPITFLIKPNPSKIKECLAEVKRQISLFDADDYLTTEQIATAQRKLEINQIRREEVTSDFVNTLSFWWSSTSLDYFFTYAANLQKVKRANLQAYVRKYIKNKPYCAGLLITPDLKAQLKTDDFFKAGK
ncbi:pitrilysin family protein [Mucilaginibacter sp. UR6-11]|uniref:M16 family metallopeptidase n=1 Tax=Mucilaginibacter sp. UR6-11 TaxID=1435644 RepID=UPI001E4962E2|nr:pitrilysin family protein [Mucilaginibacter sp. UR6-11]MCC8424140.1 insulinase family protein [Mucilaginibacter sp. UR6-11]